jgi:radical SAM protein with 4Fe4S-binding SPASM domain
MIIWTGGEPMYRPDILALVRGATERGLRSVMAPCGTLVTREALVALKEAGVMACSFSLDGATAETHDAFRGVAGAFDNVTRAMAVAREVGMPFQVNATVSRLNAEELPAIREAAIERGARTLDLFFLVPVGRGAGLRDLSLSPEQTESVLRWAFEMDRLGPLHVRETCAPQAVRIWHGLGQPGEQPAGCMGGRSFVFISHTGVLQPCGFLDVPSGELRANGFDFRKTYEASKVFHDLSQPDRYGGACGSCAFRMGCGGCRARAYAATGDYMAAETSCPIARG